MFCISVVVNQENMSAVTEFLNFDTARSHIEQLHRLDSSDLALLIETELRGDAERIRAASRDWRDAP